MITASMRLLPSHYCSKKNRSSLVLLLFFWIAPIASSEPEIKKAKISNNVRFYNSKSVPLPETLFGRWLEKNKELLKKKEAYSSDYDETRSRAVKFDKPEKLSTAGILFLIYRMPIELQQAIMQYLVDTLAPTTVGVHPEDLQQVKSYFHNKPPHFTHFPYHNIAQCASFGCNPQEVNLIWGYFKNSTTNIVPPAITSFWALIQAKAKKEKLPQPTLISVNYNNQTLFSGHEPIPDSTIPNIPTYYWQIAEQCINKKKLKNPDTHDFTIDDMIGLLDAEHSRQKKQTIALTDNSLAALKNLKRKITDECTPEGANPAEPLFIDQQLNNNESEYYRRLTRQNAFLQTDRQMFHE